MKKGQKLVPVITLVLYLGQDRLWDGARSLCEMLEMEDELKPFVNDFKLNLFDYHEWKDFSRFKTENRLLFEILSCGRNKRKMKKMLQENPEYKALDLESARAIAGMLGVKIKPDAVKAGDEEGEVYDMCKAFDDYKEEGRREGRQEGEMKALKTVVKNLMSSQKITFEEAVKMLKISKNKQKELRTLI